MMVDVRMNKTMVFMVYNTLWRCFLDFNRGHLDSIKTVRSSHFEFKLGHFIETVI